MPFPQSVKDDALARSNGRCECKRQHHDRPDTPHHGDRCDSPLKGGYHFHHIVAVEAGGKDILSNCEVLCIKCHELTRTYGRASD